MAYKFNSELELIKLEEESNSNVEEVKTYSLDKYDALVSTGVGVISGLMDKKKMFEVLLAFLKKI